MECTERRERPPLPSASDSAAVAAVAPDDYDYATNHDYNADGVDLTLIREFLRLTPTERLEVVEGWIEVMATVRRPSGERVYPELACLGDTACTQAR